MKDVFTNDRFYTGCAEYLYLFQHLATNTCCEAVLESMGSVWDKAADPRRHPIFSASAQEGVIAWGSPQAFMPEAVPFCVRALRRRFGDDWQAHFSHTDERQRQSVWTGGSKVISKWLSTRSRLPAALYGAK